MREPFIDSRHKPRLARCAVLFLDLLGVSEMNRSRKAAKHHLVQLEQAVTATYHDYLSPWSHWPAAFFSDTLVLAAPLDNNRDEALEVRQLATQGATLQLSLARAGFFARGGLSIGLFHIRQGLVFGPALVEAYSLESQVATHPRIVLSTEAAECQRSSQSSPPGQDNPLLITDGDGWTFIDYLSMQIATDPDDPGPVLCSHRDRIVESLQRHRGVRHIWEKYRWVAEYHNDVLRARLPGYEHMLVPNPPMSWSFAPFPT